MKRNNFFKEKYLLFLLLVLTSTVVFSQIGIGTIKPEGMLDLESSQYGLVYPRVALVKTNQQLPVTNPNGGNLVAGTVVYNTSTTSTGDHDVYPGVYVWDGAAINPKWIPQFILEHSALFAQNPLNFSVPLSGGFRDVPNLGNGKTFKAKYTGIYRIEANFNFGAGQALNPSGSESVRMATQEGYFRFIFNGTNYDIYTHAYSIKNNITNQNFNRFRHDSSLILYLNLSAGQTYPFRLQMDLQVSNTSDYDTATNGIVGIDVPCTIEFTYINE
ncbi:hypothetical protein LS48_08175 [Aequorivita aquimaris]|uniref:Uncharacterized protein n=1 Tax=Aequorivita aquimaris TaxID=1548749 RepID=A0A137RHT3_9FLAO|nr:hypothetical protein [Aequorivita aquimaris]KXN99044.1 hypothetical protein LS48_08175 [Aequorivita aquimaris]